MASRNLNLNRLGVFVAVVEAGSLTSAALRLGLAKTAVSTHLQRLEAEVGAALLVRTTRSLRLTEAGRSFYDACRSILADIDTAISEVDRDSTDVRGTLRITTSEEYGAMVIAPIAAALVNRYPALKIDLIAVDQILDLAAQNIDIAVRLGWLRDSSQQSLRVGSFAQWLVAPAESAAWAARLATPADLTQRKLFALSVLRTPTTWAFTALTGAQQTVRFDANLTVSTTSALRNAVLAPGSLAVLPDYIAAPDVAAGRLIRVLPDWVLPTGEIHAVFPSSRYKPLKVRIFLDALRAGQAQMGQA